MGDAFSRYHPLVNFLFFALVLAYSMVLMHPVCLAVSLLGALLYVARLKGRRALRQQAAWLVPTALLAAADGLGLRTVGGIDLLIRQAVRAFTFFTGETPDTAALYAALREPLGLA